MCENCRKKPGKKALSVRAAQIGQINALACHSKRAGHPAPSTPPPPAAAATVDIHIRSCRHRVRLYQKSTTTHHLQTSCLRSTIMLYVNASRPPRLPGGCATPLFEHAPRLRRVNHHAPRRPSGEVADSICGSRLKGLARWVLLWSSA